MSPASVASRLAGTAPYAGRDGTVADSAVAAAADDISPFMTMQNDGRIPAALRQSSMSFQSKDAYSYAAGVQAMQQDHIAAAAQRPPVPRRSSETGTAQRRSTGGGDQQLYGTPGVVPFLPLSSGWNSIDDELDQELSKELHKQKPQQVDQGHRFAPCPEDQQIWEQDSWGMFTGHMKQQHQQPQPQQQQQQQTQQHQQQQAQLQPQQSASGTPRHGRLHKLLSSLHLPQGSRCRLASHGSRGPTSPHRHHVQQQQHAVCSPAVSPHSRIAGPAVSPAVSNSAGSSTSRHSSPFAWCRMRLSDDGTSAVPGGIAGVRVPVAPLSPVASQSCPSSPFGSQPGSLRATAVPASACCASVSGPAQRQPSTAAGRIVSDPGGPPLVCMLSVSAEAEAQLLQQLSAPSVPQPQQQPAAPVPVPQADPRSSGSFNSRHIGGSGRHSHRLISSRRCSLESRCQLRGGSFGRCQQPCSSPNPKLEVSTSLRTALVQLEHTASVHANRLRERLHGGLARLTSFTPQAQGVLRLPVGREVLRDWEFLQQIGSGASCITRLVMSRDNGQYAACKTINKSGIFRSAALKAAMLGVQRELAIMQHTSGHPHVVQLRGVYEDARALHLVMDWCAGGCLEQLVACKLPEGKLQEPAVAAVAKAVLEVLAHVHERGVVHRDIKPGNVLLCRFNEEAPGELTTDDVKVTDFGISVPFTPGRPLTELAGTMEYMAPEVLQRCYGTAADVWSTGVMLHELLCGQLPFAGDTLEQMAQCIQKTEVDLSGPAWAGVSHEAKQLVALCLQKDPRDRPSARQLLDTFAGWLELGARSSSVPL